jgi:hypothetical protein
MPTLEVQLAKALKELDRLGKGKWEVNGRYWAEYGKRADQVHGDDAELRGLRERVRHLQQRIAVRDERIAQAEQHAAAKALVQLAQTYESVDLPVHTSVPTAPE